MPIGNTVYLFTRRQIGDDNELGRTLIRGFLNNLSKQEVLPRLLTPLRTLAEKGVDIAICKTCLDAYKLDAAKMPVGRVGTSPEFVKITTEYPVMTVT